MIALSQIVFFNFYMLAYLLSPRFCHKFVGYLEEEAVHTYTVLLKQIDEGLLPAWAQAKATPLQKTYYELPEEHATFRDVILAVRADESIHRDVNHKFSGLAQDADFEKELLMFLEKDERVHKQYFENRGVC